jgi:hypothetical protein
MAIKFYKILILCLLLIFLFGCGEGMVEIDKSTYEPKIVINAFIYPGKKFDRFKITRNFPMNTVIDYDDIPLKDAYVTVTAYNGLTDTLFFRTDSGYYASRDQKIIVEGGKEYTLNVRAEIEGQKLSAKSKTKVPELGFSINDEESCAGDIPYRKYFVNGLLKNPCINYSRSEGAEFYALSGNALDASTSNFIENNVFGLDKEILEENFDHFKYFDFWSAPDNSAEGASVIEIPWWLIYFYGEYRVIMYAGDLNYYHFFGTYRYVQDVDGNLREPLFYIDGDGIGVFGSAITDTIYFNITE